MRRRAAISRPPLLFNSVGIFDVIEQGKSRVKDLVRQLPVSEIGAEGIAERRLRPIEDGPGYTHGNHREY
jgi:hypothetical protein